MAESTAVAVPAPEADFDLISVPTRPPRWAQRGRSGLMVGVRWLGSVLEWCLGAATLLAGLALLAVVPVAQLLSLGYLLEAAGRVARGGRLRDAAVGVRPAARVGSIVAGCWLGLLPARFVASLAASAEWIDPGGPRARVWRVGSGLVTALTLIYLLACAARGGRLRHFAWPPGSLLWLARRLRRGGGSLYGTARDAACDFVRDLRLWHYFRLGGLGFVGSMVWLVVPVALLILGRRVPVLGVVGGVALGGRGHHATFSPTPVRRRGAVSRDLRGRRGSRAVPPRALGVRVRVLAAGRGHHPALPAQDRDDAA